jgi:RNA polymerase sigma-70 factor (ECF subfamily)
MTTAHPSPAESLESLMTRYASGDDAAFAALHRRLAPELHRYLVRLCRDETLAEDVLQMTFAKLYRFRGRYEPGASVLSWSRVIARRTLFDERRGLAARQEVLATSEAVFDGPAAARASSSAQVDHAMDLGSALSQLPEHYRSAVQLSKVLGFSGEEAARISRVTSTALKVRVHRGLALLRGLLEGAPAPA